MSQLPTVPRRHFLAQQTFHLGGLALAWLMGRAGQAAAPSKPSFVRPTFDLSPKAPAKPPRARAMISLFMQGGPSHVDLFDPKPELIKRHDQDMPGQIQFDSVNQASRKLFAPPWKFRAAGACGMELSELLPHLQGVADDLTLVRSMRTGVSNHGQSILALQSGGVLAGRPSLGSWITYALGSESDNLPAFVAMTDPSSLPVEGVYNWSNGWLPPLYQGTNVRAKEPRIPNLQPPPHLAGLPQQQMLAYLEGINRDHLAERPREDDLSARIASYALAARMQTAAREALDLSQESQATHRLYGLDKAETRDFGARCLIARRLVERGVRFVQIYTANQEWDHHSGLITSLPRVCRKVDQPSAALVRDLKALGMLDTTLVHWGGEMGRLPVVQKAATIGRDHNTYGFASWFAGGGLKGGYVHGATDEFGHHAVEQVVMHYDYHATLLHLFGLDPQHASFQRPNGTGALIEGAEPRVVEEWLA